MGTSVFRCKQKAARIVVSTALTALTGMCALPLQSWASTAPQRNAAAPAASTIHQPFEEALIAVAPVTQAETQALNAGLRAYRERRELASLRRFTTAYPSSGWNLALLTNLGLIDYQSGRFTDAIASWQAAWSVGKPLTQPAGKALADRAVGELLRMHARLGHAKELEALLQQIEGRALIGPAAEAASGARYGLWKMQNEPGVAYLCGPMALRSILLRDAADRTRVDSIEAYRSSPNGVSLADVARLAGSLQMDLVPVQRIGDAPVPVPAVVHWKVDHYAAVVEQSGALYKLEDPTFGHPLWVSKDDLLAQASGYFLIPQAQRSSAWRDVAQAEAQNIYGRGVVGGSDGDGGGPDTGGWGGGWGGGGGGNGSGGDGSGSGSNGNQPPGCGSCAYSIDLLTTSLKLRDRPVGYQPPRGPTVTLQLSYNQREAYQPAVANFGNVGPQWTLNWLSYVTDDPAVAGARVSWAKAGGGGFTFTGWDPASGALKPAYTKDGSVMVRLPVSPITYERRMPDGSREIYAASDGATAYPRRVFLSHVVDPQGHALRMEYDAQRRLVGVVDAIGQRTVLAYQLGAMPYLVTQVTDPFGRKAQLQYDSAGRLVRITDAVGLKSEFTYNGAGGFIAALKTAYGTTSFVSGEAGVQRWLDATDPLGQTERVEFRPQAPGIPVSEPVAPSGMTVVNNHLWYRNSFHWDKWAYSLAAGDYTQANITHWFHSSQNFNLASSSIESTKRPLESRVWFSTPGTSNNLASGTLDLPADQGRVLDDGTTQLTKTRYNSQGNVISLTDAVGRVVEFEYAANGVDVTHVKRWTASGYVTLARAQYNAQHRPISITDAAGQITSYTYNADGQVLARTDALGQTWRMRYNANGTLRSMSNPDGSVARSYTYDAVGRVASVTDSEGYTVRMQYDKLNRLVQRTFPDGSFESVTWNKLDIASVTDRLGRMTQYAYDKNRNMVQRTDPLGRIVKFTYFPNGLMKSLVDARGKTTRWERDIQGRTTAKVYPGGGQVSYVYEARTSRLKSRTDALNQQRSYGYARDDRITSIAYAGALQPTPNVTYTHDAYFPRLAQMQDGLGTTTFAYGPVGTPGALQPTQENGPYANDVLAYGYDALGRVASRTVDSAAEAYAYDPLGRLATQSNALGTISRSYLGASAQLTALQIAGSPVATLFEYDSNLNDRRLTRIVNHGAARSYALTSDGYRTLGVAESVNGGTLPTVSRSYGYDAADRLQTAAGTDGSSHGYSYDAGDNILQQSINGVAKNATVNSLNQVVRFDGNNLAYDANGNRIEDADAYYDWDAADRLVRVRRKAAAGHELQMQYDGFGRRLAFQLVTPAQTQSYRLLWCGQNLPCQLRNASDAVLKRYFEHGEFDVASGAKRWYAQDQIGSVRDLIDVPTGTVTASRSYAPYGTTTAGSAPEPGFTYAGLYSVGPDYPLLATYRAYRSTEANWLSRDPIEESGGLNLYAYAGGSPASGVDPLGLETCLMTTVGHFGVQDHAAVYTSRGDGGGPAIYDPGGSYSAANHAGSGDVVTGEAADMDKFRKYHGEGGSATNTKCKQTSPKEEEDIINKALSQPSTMGGFCGVAVSNVLSGSPSFPNVQPGTFWPGSVASQFGVGP